MRFEQLRCLIEIANTGTITGAAKKLYISQQAVSKSIKQLEEELGARANTMAKYILDAKDYFMHGMQNEGDTYVVHKNISYRICSNSPYLTTLSPASYFLT